MIRFSVRRVSYLLALAVFLLQQHLFTGVNWTGGVATIVYMIEKLCLPVMSLLLLTCFCADLLLMRGDSRRLTVVLLVDLTVCGLLIPSAVVTESPQLLFAAIFMLLARPIRYREILWTYYWTLGLSIAVLLAANLLGLTKSQYINFGYGVANSLGLSHPNNMAALIMAFMMLWCCKNAQGNLIWLSAVMLVTSVAVYMVMLSRTSLVLMVACWLLVLGYRLLQRLRIAWMIRCAKCGIVLVFIVSLGLMVYSPEMAGTPLATSTFLSRFTSAWSLYKQHGIKLFGSYIEFRSTLMAMLLNKQAVVLDSAYLYLILSQGIVATVLFIMGTVRCASVLSRKKQYVLLIMLALFLVGGMMEQYTLYAELNFTLLCAFSFVETDQSLFSVPVKRLFKPVRWGRESRKNRRII